MPISNTGYLVVQPDLILEGITNVYKQAYGPAFNTTPSSPNGVTIQALTNISIDAQNSQSLLYSTVYNPNVAPGIFLDSLCIFNNIQRKVATPSIVTCDVTGISGTVIPSGSLILNTNGDQFRSLGAHTLTGGTSSLQFESVVAGPIPCDANTVNRIVQVINGWDSVNNPGAGQVGTLTESDTSLRQRRATSLATTSVSMYYALLSACANEPTINSFALLENTSNTISIVNSVTINPHSIYLSVDGGSDETIANILAANKSGGCGMDGNTTLAITPIPEFPSFIFYAVWQRPSIIQIYIAITAVTPTSPLITPSDTVIRNEIYDCFYGKTSATTGITYTQPIGIGTTFYDSKFFAPLINVGIFNITSVRLSITGLTTDLTGVISLPVSQIAALTPNATYIGITLT